MLNFSFLQPFIGKPSQEVCCELNKGILAQHSGIRGRVSGDGPLYIF